MAARPLIFAIMRNGHEVIRGAQRDMKGALEKGNLDEMKAIWTKFHKWQSIHHELEERVGKDGSPRGMFQLLDDVFDGVTVEENLRGEHAALLEKESLLVESIEKGSSIDDIKAAFEEYEQANLNHLKKEEDVMMPRVAQMTQNGHDLKKYMKDDILALVIDSDDFEHFVKYANDVLERHPEGMPRVRVFDHALWAIASPDQWKKWDEWIKDTVSESSYKELQEAING